MEEGLSDFSFVDVSRSSIEEIEPHTYIYKISESGNLLLLKAPFKFVNTASNMSLPIFDKNLLEKVYVIEKDKIKDFSSYGTQLMKSDTTNSNFDYPDLSTVLAEFLLGLSFKMLANLSKFNLTTTHEVSDLRIVQLILTNKTDLEFKGIRIFYDFNRYFGRSKYKEIETNTNDLQNQTQENTFDTNKNIAEQLRELKKLLLEDLITNKDYEDKKRDLLEL